MLDAAKSRWWAALSSKAPLANVTAPHRTASQRPAGPLGCLVPSTSTFKKDPYPASSTSVALHHSGRGLGWDETTHFSFRCPVAPQQATNSFPRAFPLLPLFLPSLPSPVYYVPIADLVITRKIIVAQFGTQQPTKIYLDFLATQLGFLMNSRERDHVTNVHHELFTFSSWWEQ